MTEHLTSRTSNGTLSRRTVLQGALAGAAGLALPPLVAPAAAADTLEVVPVRDELTMITGAGGNVLVLPTGEGRVLIDSGAAEHGDALLAVLNELPGDRRIRTLFNTHWHLEQVGSNAAIGREGATIVAHEKTRQRLTVGYYLPDEDRYHPAAAPEARPAESFHTEGRTTLDGRRIDYGHLLLAHTDGDIYVYFRDANVLAVGDAVSPERDPEIDWFGGGWLGGRVDALARLLAISDDDTRFVPSYGPVVGRAEVQAEHDVMLTLFERMVELIRQGMSAEDILAAGVMDGLSRTWRDPLSFVDAAHRSLWAHHNKLSHDIV